MHAISENKSAVDKILSIFSREEDNDSYPFYIPIFEDKSGNNILTYLFSGLNNKHKEEYITKLSNLFRKSKASIQNSPDYGVL
jgi:hypothetical protein